MQQNFGESLDKGYLLWDIKGKEDFTCELRTFKNPKPFVTIPLTKAGNLPRSLDKGELKGSRIRIVSENNISLDKMRKAVDVVKHRFEPESVTFLNRAASKKVAIDDAAGFNKQDMRDIKVQEALIKNYLQDFKVSERVLAEINDLNSRFNSTIQQKEDVYRNISWSLKTLEWDNLFNYGPGNRIDFEKLEGVIGIFGKNYSGKSSIVDTLLYALYNSTSKPIRKNLNIINQNKDFCNAVATMQVGDVEYTVERRSEKYKKKLKGVVTNEARTDLEFHSDYVGQTEALNGTSRQDTDKNIRKYFGTLDDFLMTSMSSQMNSLTFIDEGSTKRKEILAKFLDLEIFDKKFRMAKEESASIRAILSKLEGVDYDLKISQVENKILQNTMFLESNKRKCEEIQEDMEGLNSSLYELQQKIEAIPRSLIGVASAESDFEKINNKIDACENQRNAITESLASSRSLFEKARKFLETFDVTEFLAKQDRIRLKSGELTLLLKQIDAEKEKLSSLRKKEELLAHVPCGDKYPSCRFIGDAHSAAGMIQITEARTARTNSKAKSLEEEIASLYPAQVEEYITKYNEVLERKNEIANEIAQNQIRMEKLSTEKLKLGHLREQKLAQIKEYEKNKEAIDGLGDLLDQRAGLEAKISLLSGQYEECQGNINMIYKQHGSLEEKKSFFESQRADLEESRVKFAAYDLLMKCYHPNGISYDIIKERLPIINNEIAKILANIVEFEIFIENDENKLDIFIKHPRYDARPLEMGSGAEKTIASMAIRLAFLTVSSLPKPDLFILDEPGTALDEENMEGFVRILDMVKNYFKTVILISHLDTLKDSVDMEINIERNGDYALVSI